MTETVAGSTGSASSVGGPRTLLDDEQIRAFVARSLARAGLDGRSVCVLVPDATRSGPLPLLLAAVHAALHGRVSRLTVLVALGTHAAMDEPSLATHLGFRPGALAATYPDTGIVQHRWWDPDAFAALGTIGSDRVAELSGGLLTDGIPVRVNRAVTEHDVVLIVGPVFPHEVVGFSGGNKYLFPGVSGRELIDVSHWLGALLTSSALIGTTGTTPVRALIDEAAAMVPAERLAFCTVTGSDPGSLRSVAFGDPVAAWASAVGVAAATHVRHLGAPVDRVLSIVPERYRDLWTGAKGFYKVEPVVADGGQVVLYAPHIRELSATHPRIAEIGYHCRDYFLGQWDRFSGVPWGDLAHSTHLRGDGTWDPVHGERARVTVTLATGIPESVTRSVGLDYLDPGSVDPAAWQAQPGTLVVPDAGEDLYRLR